MFLAATFIGDPSYAPLFPIPGVNDIPATPGNALLSVPTLPELCFGSRDGDPKGALYDIFATSDTN